MVLVVTKIKGKLSVVTPAKCTLHWRQNNGKNNYLTRLQFAVDWRVLVRSGQSGD